MHRHLTLALATLALSAAAFAQPYDNGVGTRTRSDTAYQIGYAANLNIGDSEINLSNDGIRNGFAGNSTGLGNICVNTYTFDPSEEEIACCSCLVTPNGLMSLSAKKDLVNNTLTPAIPSSIVIKLVATVPATDSKGNYTVCNPTSTITPGWVSNSGGVDGGNNSVSNNNIGQTVSGMLAWGTTLEPSGSPNTYNPVNVPFIGGTIQTGGTFNPFAVPATGVPSGEIWGLYSVCNFVQQEGSNFGVCGACALGGLSGAKN